MSMVIGALIALGLLVTIHEFGHFWVARRCGVGVICFSIGFGKPIFRWYDKHGTEFVIAMIPLGGYVKMLDERDEDQNIPPEKLPFAYTQKTVLQRMAIVVAGPLANFLLAFLLFWGIALVGTKDPIFYVDKVEPNSAASTAGLVNGLEVVAVDRVETPSFADVIFQLSQRMGESGAIVISAQDNHGHLKDYFLPIVDWQRGVDKPNLFSGLGFKPYYPPVIPKIAQVSPGAAAEKAGLQSGDILKTIDGIPMDDWDAFAKTIQKSADKTIIVTFERDKELKTTQVHVAKHPDFKDSVGFVGIAVEIPNWPTDKQRHIQLNVISAMVKAVHEVKSVSVMTLVSIKKILVGQLSPKNLSGPITIAKVAGSSIDAGLMSFLKFLALLSVSLGVFNLLPIPILDGGHLLFLMTELVFGRPVSQNFQALAMQVGVFLMLGIMLFAIMNDLSWL